MHKYNYDFFKHIDTEAKAYVLAWFWFRGSGHIQINVRDIDILETIKELIDFSGPIHIYNNIADLNIYSEPLLSCGCVPNRNFVQDLPSLSDGLYQHFTRGLFDSYGSIIIHKHKYLNISILSCENLITSLRKYLKVALDINTKHYYRYSHTTALQMMITNTLDAKKFCDYIYSGSNLYMARKFAKYQEYSQKGV